MKRLLCKLINGNHVWVESNEEGVYKVCSYCGAKKMHKTLSEMDEKSLKDVDESFGDVSMPNLEAFISQTTSNKCPHCGLEFTLSIVSPLTEMDGLYLTECSVCKERCYKGVMNV